MTALGPAPVQNHYLADVTHLFHPFKEYVASALRHGRLPLWIPEAGLGYPLLASQESAFAWSTPLYAFLSFWTARAIELAGILLLAGIGAYLFARSQRIGQAGAMLTAVVSILGFQFTQHLLTGHLVQSLVWLPFILLVLDGARRTSSTALLFLAGGLMGISFLAGSLQGMLYVLMAVVVDVSWHGVESARTGGRRSAAFASLRVMALLTGVSVMVAAVRILPTLELLRLNERSLELSLAAWASAAGRRLLGLLVACAGSITPGALGDHHSIDLTKVLGNMGIRGEATGQEFKPYVSWIPLLCAGLAVGNLRSDPRVARHLALLVIPTAAAVLTPFSLLAYFPRVLVLTVIPLAMLAGLGLDRLWNSQDQRTLTRWTKTWMAAVWVYIALAAVGSGLLRVWSERVRALGRSAVSRSLALQNAWDADSEWQLTKVDRLVQTLSFPSAALMAPGLVGLAGAGALMGFSRGLRWQAAAVAIGVTVADLSSMGRDFLPTARPSEVFPSTPVTEFLQRTVPPLRATGIWRLGRDTPLFPPNTLMAYGIADTRAYESLVPDQGLGRDLSLGRVASLGYVVVPHHELLAGGTLIYDREVRVYKLSRPLPRAYGVYGAVAAASDGAARDLIRSGRVDVSTTVVLRGRVARSHPTSEAPDVRRVSSTGERTTLRTDFARPGYAVVTDRYYPGWISRVDGRKMSVLPADGGIMAVAVPSGRHTVEFEYRPNSVLWGASVSCVSLAMLGGVMGSRAARRRRKLRAT